MPYSRPTRTLNCFIQVVSAGRRQPAVPGSGQRAGYLQAVAGYRNRQANRLANWLALAEGQFGGNYTKIWNNVGDDVIWLPPAGDPGRFDEAFTVLCGRYGARRAGGAGVAGAPQRRQFVYSGWAASVYLKENRCGESLSKVPHHAGIVVVVRPHPAVGLVVPAEGTSTRRMPAGGRCRAPSIVEAPPVDAVPGRIASAVSRVNILKPHCVS